MQSMPIAGTRMSNKGNKYKCMGCKADTEHVLQSTLVDMPAGLSEASCEVCGSWRIVMTDKTLAQAFMDAKKF
jgi:DNA-directed RNA polymerase subunit RPC12/RpoP